jgi:hypothetical protein
VYPECSTLQTQLLFCKSFFLFGDRIFARDIWPSRYPDFTPPDFLQREFLKGSVYSKNPLNLEKLKHTAEQIVASTDPRTLRSAARVNACFQAGGGHFQHLP